MTFAAAALRPETARTLAVRQAALAFGSAQFAARLRDLFRRPRWDLEWPGDSEAGYELLNRNEFPVVICEGDWRRITRHTSHLLNPPAVIAVDRGPNGPACGHAVDHGVLYLDDEDLRPGILFPLLNHAWRMRNPIHL
ncbi:MAG: hypothetical protein KGN84_04260 [Acidobacteriota bacterium]|nr:hypothetical protein [Acidobacteriota bacterium]